MDDKEVFMKTKEDWEEQLPQYLKHDIENVEKYSFKTSTVYDCYLNEVYGSINACQWDGVISIEQADYLRKKYWEGNYEKGRE